ncbi:transmembrane protein 273-like [Triplophysa dalaica]|uniref:transmembrane protein 273-like n=1 Tax=Triplophysa dalaica TaxID=1582913 RepID=UPI0024DF408D|nr:transmembrane protein 273-like [Triplophysa dalaica]
MFDHARYCSAILIFTIDCLLFTHVKGQNSTSDEPASEIKYAVIGVGIGFFFSICFLVIKIYIIRKHMHENDELALSSRRASVRNVDVDR